MLQSAPPHLRHFIVHLENTMWCTSTPKDRRSLHGCRRCLGKELLLPSMALIGLSKASVTSYLPYEKGVYFPNIADKEKISVGAERQRRYRAVRKLRTEPTEEHLWEVVLLYAGVSFKTYSGLPFTYEIRKGRNGQYTKELWIDRREKSKSLAWSSVLLALGNIKKVGEVVERPKALGDIRGVTYIYGMFYRFGLIDVPDEAKEKMKKAALYGAAH